MRIDPTITRIRAVVRAVAFSIAIQTGVIRSSVLTSYIRIRTVLGEFLKQKAIVDRVSITEGDQYFAEDYVEPGYVGFSLVFSINKVLADGSTVTDLFSISLPKTFSDTATLTDTARRRPTKGLSEALTLADTTARSTIKAAADTATLADTARRRSTKGLSDTSTLADVVALLPRIAIIDQPIVSDAGSLRMQDYCSFDYFAEDYVGESRVFT